MLFCKWEIPSGYLIGIMPQTDISLAEVHCRWQDLSRGIICSKKKKKTKLTECEQSWCSYLLTYLLISFYCRVIIPVDI